MTVGVGDRRHHERHRRAGPHSGSGRPATATAPTPGAGPTPLDLLGPDGLAARADQLVEAAVHGEPAVLIERARVRRCASHPSRVNAAAVAAGSDGSPPSRSGPRAGPRPRGPGAELGVSDARAGRRSDAAAGLGEAVGRDDAGAAGLRRRSRTSSARAARRPRGGCGTPAGRRSLERAGAPSSAPTMTYAEPVPARASEVEPRMGRDRRPVSAPTQVAPAGRRRAPAAAPRARGRPWPHPALVRARRRRPRRRPSRELGESGRPLVPEVANDRGRSRTGSDRGRGPANTVGAIRRPAPRPGRARPDDRALASRRREAVVDRQHRRARAPGLLEHVEPVSGRGAATATSSPGPPMRCSRHAPRSVG